MVHGSAWLCYSGVARAWLKTNRLTWTGQQITITLTAIWNANQRVKDYYEDTKGTDDSPDLPAWLDIPVNPYSQAQAKAAKNNKTFPGLLPDLAVEQGESDSEDEVPSGTPDGGGSPGGNPNGPMVIGGVIAAPDSRPYNFWPQEPWNNEDVYTSAEAQRSIEITSGQVHRWTFQRPLERYSLGNPQLYYRTDETKNIIDKMVSTARAFTIKQWRDPQEWRDRRPRAIRIHELVEQCREQRPDTCHDLIYCRGSRMNMRTRRYELFEDYFNENTITSLLNSVNRRFYIQEAFVWQVIRGLARACLTLQTGSHEADGAVEGWRPITHLSLQPHNVFLHVESRSQVGDDPDGERPAKRRRYGPIAPKPSRKGKERARVASSDDEGTLHENIVVPVLGNLSLAFFSVCENANLIPDNPNEYILNMEDTRYAPEHQSQIGQLPITLDDKTDVWGIGMIASNIICDKVLELGPVTDEQIEPTDLMKPPEFNSEEMRLKPVGKRRAGEAFVPTDQNMFTGVHHGHVVHLDPALLDVVRRCLCYDKDARYSMRELLDRVDQELAARPKLLDISDAMVRDIIGPWDTPDGPPVFGPQGPPSDRTAHSSRPNA